MKRFFVFVILTSISLCAVFGQVKESRLLSDFNGISIGEAIHLTLIPGDKNEAVLTVENIDLADVQTEVRGSNLKIGLEGGRHRNVKVFVSLTYKSIEEISVSSAADVITQGPIKSDAFDISVSSAGSAKLEIDAKEIEVAVSSAGDLSLTGKCISQRIEVSSAGEYNGYELACETSYVRVSSAASAKVVASKQIDAKANSAGSIRYKGNPQKVYVSANSGGHVKKAN